MEFAFVLIMIPLSLLFIPWVSLSISALFLIAYYCLSALRKGEKGKRPLWPLAVLSALWFISALCMLAGSNPLLVTLMIAVLAANVIWLVWFIFGRFLFPVEDTDTSSALPPKTDAPAVPAPEQPKPAVAPVGKSPLSIFAFAAALAIIIGIGVFSAFKKESLFDRLITPSYSFYRSEAMSELKKLSLQDQRALIPKLIKKMKNGSNKYERLNAAGTLGFMGPDVAASAIPDLKIAAEKDEDADVRNSAVEALAQMGANTQETIDRLIGELEKPDAEKAFYFTLNAINRVAYHQADKVKKYEPRIIKVLISHLSDKDSLAQTIAIDHLRGYASSKKEVLRPALPVVIRMLNKGAPDGRDYAILDIFEAIASLNPSDPALKEAVPGLKRIGDDNYPRQEDSKQARDVLRMIGVPVKEPDPCEKAGIKIYEMSLGNETKSSVDVTVKFNMARPYSNAYMGADIYKGDAPLSSGYKPVEISSCGSNRNMTATTRVFFITNGIYAAPLTGAAIRVDMYSGGRSFCTKTFPYKKKWKLDKNKTAQ